MSQFQWMMGVARVHGILATNYYLSTSAVPSANVQ